MGNRNQATIERYLKAVESGDLAEATRLLGESATNDFVEEWPQSGERIVGIEALKRINEGYGAATGTSPKMSLRRISGSGDLHVVEGTIDYGDGVPVSYVGITEFRDGKVAKVTEYFANPFEAPAWRADMVERMESVSF
jgi:ketosteroid isomerase-like protein